MKPYRANTKPPPLLSYVFRCLLKSKSPSRIYFGMVALGVSVEDIPVITVTVTVSPPSTSLVTHSKDVVGGPGASIDSSDGAAIVIVGETE